VRRGNPHKPEPDPCSSAPGLCRFERGVQRHRVGPHGHGDPKDRPRPPRGVALTLASPSAAASPLPGPRDGCLSVAKRDSHPAAGVEELLHGASQVGGLRWGFFALHRRCVSALGEELWKNVRGDGLAVREEDRVDDKALVGVRLGAVVTMAVARAPTPPVLLGPSRSRKPAWHHGQVARRVRIHPQDRPTQLDIHLGVPSAPLPLRLARRAAIPQHQPPGEPVGSLSCQHGLLEVCFFGTPGLVSMGTRSGGVLLRAGARGGSKRIVELVVAARALTIALALALALTGAKEDLQPSKGDLPEG